MRAIMNRVTILPFADALSSANAVLGDLAQLGERLLCKQEVSGSNPLVSIVLSRHLRTDVRATSAHDMGIKTGKILVTL